MKLHQREPETRAAARRLIVAAVVASGLIVGSASEAANNSSLSLHGTDVRTGKPVSLAADAGKPVVVNLWSSTCGACFADASALAAFERAHPIAHVLGVDVTDSTAGARSLYRRAGWRHPSIADSSGRIAAQLQLRTLPTTLFLNAKHEVVERTNGQTTAAGFAAGFRKASERSGR